ncbi:hypothetical protein MKX01_001604 [Papaver californicum]|nr:hypothetical protein MKX01_001604 [Papaver californicum]
MEEVQGGSAIRKKKGHSNIEFDEEEKDKSKEEEEIVVAPVAGKVLEGRQASGLKKKVANDKEEVSKKVNKPKKVLKKYKKKVEEVQGDAAKKEKRVHSNIEFDEKEKDKCEEEKEIVAVPMAGKLLEGSQVSVLKRKVSNDEEKDSNKVKKPKKVVKKFKKKVEEVQGDGAKKEEEDKSKEEEEIAAIPMVKNVSEDCQSGVPQEEICLRLGGRLEESLKA